MKLIFESKKHEAGNAWSFRFQPEEPLTWVAGQYMRWEIAHENPDSEDVERWFTISSAPSEGFVQLTTRLTGSSFKKALDALSPGDTIVSDTLDGDFVWIDGDRPKLFVAGGIGITPFHSILKQRQIDGQSTPVTLIYYNRDEDVVFRDEFDAIPWLTVKYITGSVDSRSIMTADASATKKHIYLSGPEAMVEAVGADLINNGLAKEQLKQDWFPGYDQTSF